MMLMAGLSRDLVQKGLDAVEWVRPAAGLVQGGGGGRPDMAQAGGKDATKLAERSRRRQPKSAKCWTEKRGASLPRLGAVPPPPPPTPLPLTSPSSSLMRNRPV